MQKNSGNKGAKRSGAGDKSRREVGKLFDFIRTTDNDQLEDSKHVAKVVRKFGNGRIEVMYTKKEIEVFVGNDGETIEKESNRVYQKQAIIRGTFRGRGKREVWIDIGSVVIVEENVDILEVIAVLSRDQLRELSKQIFIDSRILAEGTRDEEIGITDGIEFADDNEPETVIVAKKDKHKHERSNGPSDDIDIDDI